MLSPDTQILIASQVAGLCFYAGIHVATLRGKGRELKGVKTQVKDVQKDVQVHDREIGVAFGRLQLPREVRR